MLSVGKGAGRFCGGKKTVEALCRRATHKNGVTGLFAHKGIDHFLFILVDVDGQLHAIVK